MQIDPKTYDMSGAQMYRKKGTVFARPAVPGETIETMIDDKVETTNTANAGDFVVRNPGGEEYIIGGVKFNSRYVLADPQPDTCPDGYHQYTATGKTLALQVPEAFTITAPWGEEQHIGANGWLAINPEDATDVYGIDGQAFADTYELDQ